jgi:hypothetical protein
VTEPPWSERKAFRNCHVGPGASGWVESKKAGSRQFIDTIFHRVHYPTAFAMEIGAYRAIHRSACVLAPRGDSLVDVVLADWEPDFYFAAGEVPRVGESARQQPSIPGVLRMPQHFDS